ncbi:Hypothetical predicted protein [Octopus vulgaris]|uniref:Uncharacterized protein n=1 Tax=Octopus vulgaris TaxID=6645 RepID=A0AA36AS80_OCTVU|nr:Hypothetical predicted protein [Octopus vulgaris]
MQLSGNPDPVSCGGVIVVDDGSGGSCSSSSSSISYHSFAYICPPAMPMARFDLEAMNIRYANCCVAYNQYAKYLH